MGLWIVVFGGVGSVGGVIWAWRGQRWFLGMVYCKRCQLMEFVCAVQAAALTWQAWIGIVPGPHDAWKVGWGGGEAVCGLL